MEKLTAKRLVIILAALCIAVALITTNNAATIMAVRAQRNRNGSQTVQQAPGSSTAQSGSVSSNGTGSGSSGSVTPTPDSGSSSGSSDASGSSDNSSTPSGGSQGSQSSDSSSGSSSSGSASDNKTDSGKTDSNATLSAKEVVDYYKKAHNNATSKAKKVVLKTDGATNYNNVFEAGMLTSIGQGLVGQFMGVSEVNKEIDPKTLPPAAYISGLDVADVKEATRTESGNYYIVKIVMKDDVNPVPGKGSGALVSIITENQITEPVEGMVTVSNIKLSYYGSNVEAKIEKSTGNMVYLKTDAPSVLSLDAKAGPISMNGAQVGIQCTSEYELSY